MVKVKRLAWVWPTVVKDSAHVAEYMHVSVSTGKQSRVLHYSLQSFVAYSHFHHPPPVIGYYSLFS